MAAMPPVPNHGLPPVVVTSPNKYNPAYWVSGPHPAFGFKEVQHRTNTELGWLKFIPPLGYLIFGRDPAASHVFVGHPTVSTQHAVAVWDVRDGHCYILDLESKYGTFVDDTMLDHSVPYELVPGARVRFGHSAHIYVFAKLPEEFIDPAQEAPRVDPAFDARTDSSVARRGPPPDRRPLSPRRRPSPPPYARRPDFDRPRPPPDFDRHPHPPHDDRPRPPPPPRDQDRDIDMERRGQDFDRRAPPHDMDRPRGLPREPDRDIDMDRRHPHDLERRGSWGSPRGRPHDERGAPPPRYDDRDRARYSPRYDDRHGGFNGPGPRSPPRRGPRGRGRGQGRGGYQ